VLWRPVAALASIMVMTGVAARVGVFGQLVALLVPRASAGAARLFALVFGLSFAPSPAPCGRPFPALGRRGQLNHPHRDHPGLAQQLQTRSFHSSGHDI
jgi:hypothetical protein